MRFIQWCGKYEARDGVLSFGNPPRTVPARHSIRPQLVGRISPPRSCRDLCRPKLLARSLCSLTHSFQHQDLSLDTPHPLSIRPPLGSKCYLDPNIKILFRISATWQTFTPCRPMGFSRWRGFCRSRRLPKRHSSISVRAGQTLKA